MEIEVKYKGEEGIDLFAHPLLAPFLGPLGETPMSAFYYDTPESGCAQAGFALRLRREGPESVCTVKGGGMQDGVARRVEIEEKADTLEQGVQALLNRPDLPGGLERAFPGKGPDGVLPLIRSVVPGGIDGGAVPGSRVHSGRGQRGPH